MEKTISFPSKIENITIAEKLIDDITTSYRLGSEIYGNILVSVIEAVNNGICHGNQNDPSKMIYISLIVQNKELIFKIKDEGNGFDIKKIPDPTLPENLEKPYGRGIFLIKHLADDVKYNKNGNEIEIKFKI